MQLESISLPQVYKDSQDFRVLLAWIYQCFEKVKYDTEHLVDIYDPLKCKEELLWMLGDTIGYKYDDRLPTCFNRLVILNFINMIKKKGSKDGVTFAAEMNLAQLNLISYGAGYSDEDDNFVPGKEILYNRLEDTSVPVNSVYVNPNVEFGYIDVVYFSTEEPIDACIEYVRPLGMYLFQHPGVEFNARAKISVDARLTNIDTPWESIGAAHVTDYSRNDYASLQKVEDLDEGTVQTARSLKVKIAENRDPSYYRNKDYEVNPSPKVNPGYRALYSLQLSNNEHVVKSLIDPIFSLGYKPQAEGEEVSDESFYITENDVTVVNPESYLVPPYSDSPAWNLRLDRDQELTITENFTTLNEDISQDSQVKPTPAVNPVMGYVGDAIEVDIPYFSKVDEDGTVGLTDISE